VKAGDLVRLRSFPPIGMGTGANPKCGLLVRPVLDFEYTCWWVLLEGKEYKLHEVGLEVISETRS